MPIDQRTRDLAFVLTCIAKATSLEELRSQTQRLNSLAEEFRSNLLIEGYQAGYQAASREFNGITGVIV